MTINSLGKLTSNSLISLDCRKAAYSNSFIKHDRSGALSQKNIDGKSFKVLSQIQNFNSLEKAVSLNEKLVENIRINTYQKTLGKDNFLRSKNAHFVLFEYFQFFDYESDLDNILTYSNTGKHIFSTSTNRNTNTLSNLMIYHNWPEEKFLNDFFYGYTLQKNKQDTGENATTVVPNSIESDFFLESNVSIDQNYYYKISGGTNFCDMSVFSEATAVGFDIDLPNDFALNSQQDEETMFHERLSTYQIMPKRLFDQDTTAGGFELANDFEFIVKIEEEYDYSIMIVEADTSLKKNNNYDHSSNI